MAKTIMSVDGDHERSLAIRRADEALASGDATAARKTLDGRPDEILYVDFGAETHQHVIR